MYFKVEKHRPVLECLLPFAHVLLVGKDFALLQGARDCVESCKIISTKVQPGTVVITAWGDQGAAYCVALSDPNDVQVMKQDAYVPDKIIDSLGRFVHIPQTKNKRLLTKTKSVICHSFVCDKVLFCLQRI